MILDSLPVFFFLILTCFRRERENEQYRNTVKDLLLPYTPRMKNVGWKTAYGEIPLEKKLNTAIT